MVSKTAVSPKANSVKKKSLCSPASGLAFLLMKVEFYGHVRQYHNIKSRNRPQHPDRFGERPVRHGADAQEFESELAAYHGLNFAIGTGNGTDSIWLASWLLVLDPGMK